MALRPSRLYVSAASINHVNGGTFRRDSENSLSPCRRLWGILIPRADCSFVSLKGGFLHERFCRSAGQVISSLGRKRPLQISYGSQSDGSTQFRVESTRFF